MQLQLLFPTVIAHFQLDPPLTRIEEEIITSVEHENNICNTISKSFDILNDPGLLRIQKFITESVNRYLKEVISPVHDCELYVSLSWVNFTDVGQQHHLHYHTNSILSGVLYVDVDSERDLVIFHKKQNRGIKIYSNPQSSLNYDVWSVPVEKNLLIVFPSDLDHETPILTTGKKRVSLSFNTFFRGTIGEKTTKLVLGD